MHTTHRTLLFSGLVAFGLGLSTAPGCGPGDYCAQFLGKQIECAPTEQKALFEGSKDRTLKECRERKDRDAEEEQAELQCAQKGACEEFKKCMDSLADARYAGKLKKEIAAALKSGEKMDDMVSTCKFNDVKDEDVKRLCGELFTKAVDTATRDLEALRDKGADPEGKCFDLSLTAEKVSPEAKTKADLLCKEVDAAHHASEAITAVKKNLDGKVHEVPFQCSLAVEDLEKIGNDWSKARLAEVTRACYVDLGNAILPALVPTMEHSCDYHVDEVFRAVKRHALKDAALDPWIDKAAVRCAGTPDTATPTAAG